MWFGGNTALRVHVHVVLMCFWAYFISNSKRDVLSFLNINCLHDIVAINEL